MSLPKELHLRNIVGTFVEELALWRGATPEGWELVERAAAASKKTRWEYLEYLLGCGLPHASSCRGPRAYLREIRRQRLAADGKEKALAGVWSGVCSHARQVIAEEERRAATLATAEAIWGEQKRARAAQVLDKALAGVREYVDAPACGRRREDEVKAADYMPYVMGRFAAVREAGLVCWDVVDQAAARAGISWREYLARAVVRDAVFRISLGGMSCAFWRASRVRVLRRCGEASFLSFLWVVVLHYAQADVCGECTMPPLCVERAEWLPVFERFVKGEAPASELPAWLRG